ncbi:uncharacterized protein LOC127103426 [Lathyrus oleraceus]|nr:uncharacterized protein LOC127103426 [Pisum sativum]
MATQLVAPTSSQTEKVHQFFNELESHKNTLTKCTDLFTTLSNHFSTVQDSISQKLQTLDSKFQSLESRSKETLESLDNQENSIPERESSAAARIDEQKEAALADLCNSVPMSTLNISDALKSLSRKMDASALLRFVVSKRKESIMLRPEIVVAIKEAVDPPRLVLDAVEEYLKSKTEAKSGVTDKRWACGLLIQGLIAESSVYSRRIVERAAGLVDLWKEQLDGEHEKGAAEMVMFLQIVACFGLRSKFDDEYLRKSVMEFASRRDMAKVAASLEFGDKMIGLFLFFNLCICLVFFDYIIYVGSILNQLYELVYHFEMLPVYDLCLLLLVNLVHFATYRNYEILFLYLTAIEAASLLQNLSLDSQPKTISGDAEPVKKNGPSFAGSKAKGTGKPFNPNLNFAPNGYPSTAYYYGGYDGQGDWSGYSNYANLDGGMAQGVYGDNCSYMYQGYGYTPYGAYASPNSSSPMVQHDGQLYGLQQYQYPCSYYNSPTSADVFAPNKTSVAQREMSTAANADRVPSNVMNNGNSVGIVNGDCTNQSGLKSFITSSQHTSLNTRDSYQGSSLPACAPLSKLVPTLEEYSYYIGLHVSNQISFSGLEEISKSCVIGEAMHLRKGEIDANLVTKGGILGLHSKFLMEKPTTLASVGGMVPFEVVLALLIYGKVLFPNVDNFMDINVIRIFLIQNPVPTFLADTYYFIHHIMEKIGGTIM